MASAYKWRITNLKYAFITDENGGEPFITDNLDPIDENTISVKTNQLNEENYASKYNLMVEKIKSDSDGANMDLPDYRYYYNVDNISNCATINYGIQGANGANGVGISTILQTKSVDGVNTITFVLTDGTSHDIFINDGANGSEGLTGPIGEQGEAGNDATLSDNVVRRIVNEMNITSAVTLSLMTELSPQYNDLLKKYTVLEEKYAVLEGNLSATTVAANEALNIVKEEDGQIKSINSKITTIESISSAHTNNINNLNSTNEEFKETLDTLKSVIGNLSGITNNIVVEFDKIKELFNINIGSQVLLSGFVESVNLRLDDFSENIQNNKRNIISLNKEINKVARRVSICERNYSANTSSINSIISDYTKLNEGLTNISGATSSAITSIDYLYENAPTIDEINNLISDATYQDFSNLNGKIGDNRNGIETLTKNYTGINVEVSKYVVPNLNGAINSINKLSETVSELQNKVNRL